MAALLHPRLALYGEPQFPSLAACEHYCGTVKQLGKAVALQNQRGPLFDITADCEDGAPLGEEISHARALAECIASADNLYDRIGIRIHDVRHPAWKEEVDTILAIAGERVAYIVLPKAEGIGDVLAQIEVIEAARQRYGIRRPLPLHVLIETPQALHQVWQIAALEAVETLDFGLMDFVSAHGGAIPEAAMRSPGQFEHPLIRRAKCEIAAAALAHHKIPAHNVTTEFRNPSIVAEDARRARQEFGFLRMWSIHPNQIEPIIAAMRPPFADVELAGRILIAAQEARWGPIQIDGRLHDRASYRYYWQMLLDARRTGQRLPPEIERRFFSELDHGESS